MPLSHGKSHANPVANPANALVRLEEREGYPFAARLFSHAHIAHLWKFSQLASNRVTEGSRSNAVNDFQLIAACQ